MKYIICLLILLILGVLYLSKINESFTVYQLNYKTRLEPAWPNMSGLKIGYNRCICSSNANCQCLDDNQLDTIWDYPDIYFNLDSPYYLHSSPYNY